MDRAFVQTDVDKYIIVEYIAEGGMGAIFRGKKVGMVGFEKEVVLKQLLPEFTSQPEFIDLFLREARLSASLDHANIVHTIDLVTANQDYFIVMEYVRGGDLRNLQRRIKQLGQRLLPAAALFIARELLSALAYAHEKCSPDGQPLKLIHRDVSPSNIMISASGEVKLADFGIAKASTHKSVYYRVKGKVGYMSPEQARSETLDHRSDLYSLAVCLYELLSSERLFVADLMSTANQIYNQPISALEDLPDIPRGTDAVLARALAKDREARYQTAHELQDALVQLAYDNGIVFTAPDLADHLKAVCGPDPATWNKELEEQAEPTGTQVLNDELSQLSKVELTSVFTEQSAELRSDEVGDDEATRHIRLDPQDIAFDPTRIRQSPLRADLQAAEANGEPELAAADTAEAAWDDNSESLTIHETSRTVAVHGEIYRPPAPRPALRSPEESSQRRSSPSHAAAKPLPPAAHAAARHQSADPLSSSWSTPKPSSRQTPSPRPLAHPSRQTPSPRPLAHPSSTPAARAAVSRPSTPRPQKSLSALQMGQGPSTAADHEPESAPVAARVALPRGAYGSLSAGRGGVVVASLILLLLSGIIALVIGLTGPDLASTAPPGLLLDLGSAPDLSPSALAATTSSAAIDAAGFALSASAADSSPPSSPAQQEQKEQKEPTAGPLGQLKVISSPPNATVYLDGSRQCQTPCIVEELQRKQVYLLSVRRSGYTSWSSLVTIGEKRALPITVYLQEELVGKPIGFLLIRSRPRADVYLNGKEIGRVTSEGRIPMLPGRYVVTLSHPRKRRRPQYTVVIKPGRIVTLRSRF